MENTYGYSAWIYDIEQRHKSQTIDVPFYLEYARQQNGEILELGCGTGRIVLMLALSGKGIAILGNKNGGKTSTVLSILHDTEFRYVVNDDISLNISKSMKLLGSPRAIGMNRDTLPYLPKIEKYVEESILKHPTNQYDSKSSKVELTIQEIQSALNIELLKVSELKCVIFPEWENNIQNSYLLELNRQDAKQRLSANIESKPDKHS